MENSQNDYPIKNFNNKAVIINSFSYLSPDLVSFPLRAREYIDSIVVSNGLINDRIEKLAWSIIEDYSNKKLTILAIMKGSVVFVNALQNKISEIAKSNKNVKCDIFYEYVTLSSYVNKESTGKLQLKSDESVLFNLKDKDVLIAEDMFDSGSSLTLLLDFFKKYEFRSMNVAMLFLKANPKNIKHLIEFDYLGFVVPNDFMVGFGLDYNECFRDLPHLCKINDKGVEEFKKK